MEELKPCPFCGSEHVVCTKPTTWQVWCTDCKCIGPWKTERKDAIAAWNKRAQKAKAAAAKEVRS